MDRYALRREVERAYASGSKNDLCKHTKPEDVNSLVDILWEYMNEADDGTVAKRELKELQERIKTLNNKSGQRVRCLKLLEGRRALVQLGPLKEEVMISPTVDITKLKLGTEVLVIGSQEGRLIAAIREPAIYDGRISKIQRVLDTQRVVIDENGNQIVLKIADWVRCKEGDEIRYDLESQMVLEVLSTKEKTEFVLSNIPTETFDDVKGLEEEKKYLYERVIYPAVYREKFDKYGIKPIKGAILHGPPGCGKAQPLDADILTPSGYIKMKDVRVGTIVSTPDGSSALVSGIFPQGEIDIYRVVFSDGTSTECSLDHLWKIYKKDSSSSPKVWALKQIVEDGLYRTKTLGKYYKFNIPLTEPTLFISNDLPIPPYVLGALLGDGCFGLSGGSIRLSCKDGKVAQLCNNYLDDHIIKESDSGHYRLINSSNKFKGNNKYIKFLRNLNLWNKGSNEKFIPEIYKLSSISDRILLLSGLFDTDGCPNKNLRRIHYTTISKQLANDVKFIIQSLGGICSIYETQPKIKNSGLVFELYISLPNNIVPFCLENKKNIYINNINNLQDRKIKNIEYVGKKEAQCIYIEHSDHLYITNDFIVTHNTYLAGAIFNEMAKVKQKQSPTLKEKTNINNFFIINGPSLLSKWAGNTEAAIRKIFESAREAAKTSGFPSIIFWDEIESITGKRKDTSTYTPEKTVVPTLLAELQGVERDNDVILIGATNRPDLIDPALMRPGRLGDAILEIPRPDRDAAKQILGAKFTKSIPPALETLLKQELVEKLIAHVYDNEKPLATAKTGSGKVINIMRQEMTNGALFANIGEELVRKACLIEINENEQPLEINGAIQMIDSILLMQLGVLDAGAKTGFEFNISDYVIDVSLNA